MPRDFTLVVGRHASQAEGGAVSLKTWSQEPASAWAEECEGSLAGAREQGKGGG